MRSVFLRVLENEGRARRLREATRWGAFGSDDIRFPKDPADFRAIPGSPFAYWLAPRLFEIFRELDPFETGGRCSRVGMQTSDDFRFVRLHWGVRATSPRTRWFPLVKGGGFAPFYAALPALVNWESGGAEAKAFAERTPGTTHWSRNLRSTGDYFRPGLTWPIRGYKFSAQAVGSGAAFSIAGKMAFVEGDHVGHWLALFNSAPFDALISVLAGNVGGKQYEAGLIQRLPVPNLTPADEEALAGLARRAWSLKRSLDTRTETSHAFVLPALLQVDGRSLAERAGAWAARVREVEAELAAIQAEIDERCFTLYGIDEEDRRAITEGFGGGPAGVEDAEGETGEEAEPEDEEEAEATADTTTLAAELVAWAVGVAFGRFDVRLATGARDLPAEPEPFDPLPVCSPAMLTGADGLPLDAPPAGYPIAFPADGILVDDPGHPRDLLAAVRAVFETVFGPRAEAIWQEAAELLDPRGHDLRTWLRTGFFEHHLRQHSKSRRKAPILWQLGTPSARYSTWLYAHRLTRDSLFALARDVVAPKLALEERRRTSLVQEAGPSPTARQRAEIAAQDALVEELRVFGEEVRRVAPLWNPDLDDGIVLVKAPLWRLVPAHRPWQKELKARWDDLVAGKYDWAHLAMHLWPERVVPKCATDRSLAIAHGLEEVFWVEGADGKWTRRPEPTRSIDELVAERTSPAVKAALADLLAAPAPAGAGGRRRKGE